MLDDPTSILTMPSLPSVEVMLPATALPLRVSSDLDPPRAILPVMVEEVVSLEVLVSLEPMVMSLA